MDMNRAIANKIAAAISGRIPFTDIRVMYGQVAGHETSEDYSTLHIQLDAIYWTVRVIIDPDLQMHLGTDHHSEGRTVDLVKPNMDPVETVCDYIYNMRMKYDPWGRVRR